MSCTSDKGCDPNVHNLHCGYPKCAYGKGMNTPRANQITLWTPAERAIQDAVIAVENMGAHLLLTDAVVLLGEARKKVAQYVDRKEV